MAVPTRFDQLSCYHGAQDGAGSRNEWQSWQDGYMHSSVPPIHASSKPQVDNAPDSVATLMAVQNNFDKATAACNNGFSESNGCFNELLFFSGSQHALLPWTDLGGIPSDQFGGWNCASGATFSTGLPTDPPLMFNLPDYSTLNQPALAECGRFEDLNHVNIQNAEPSGPTGDQLPLPSG